MARETRSTYTEGIFEDINATSLEEVFEQQAKNIETLREDLKVQLESLKQEVLAGDYGDIRDAFSLLGIERAMFQKIFMDSVIAIKDKAHNFLITEAVKSTVATQEYNYDLYVNHLLSAMEANQDKLIAIIPNEEAKSVEVKVSLNSLGKPEEWGKAIEAYRNQRNLGKVSKRDKEVGSKIWKEKIYGVGREGGTVQRYYKKDQTSKDVTDKYKNLYRDTIAGRLANIPGGASKAPFWYLIEHGNANVNLGIDADGVPYPTFGPTNFVRNSELAIASAFEQIWTELGRETLEFIKELLKGTREITTPVPPPETPEERKERLRRIKTGQQKIRAARKVQAKVRGKVRRGEEIAEGKLAAFINTQHGRFEAYVQGESIRVSLRDPKSGQFVQLPWNFIEVELEKYAIAYGL